MIDFWNSLSANQQISLLQQIVLTLSIIIGAVVSITIFSMTKRKEIKFKVHEQRKDRYKAYLTIYVKALSNPEATIKGTLPMPKEEWAQIQMDLILYGSAKVLYKIIEMNKMGRVCDTTDKNIIIKLGELIHVMRKEVGLTNKKLSIRESLSLFITDIFESKYDYLFIS
ncbi:MAG: hypothetical protein P9L97_02220 [Candidatus Tenebribacter davisii]|nr:hypothetical protein [Candidatus Tenebribacter davisii]